MPVTLENKRQVTMDGCKTVWKIDKSEAIEADGQTYVKVDIVNQSLCSLAYEGYTNHKASLADDSVPQFLRRDKTLSITRFSNYGYMLQQRNESQATSLSTADSLVQREEIAHFMDNIAAVVPWLRVIQTGP